MADRDAWFPFYPAHWLNDLELISLPMDTQGVYANLLCYLYQANPPGYLLVSGENPPQKVMSKLLRVHPSMYRRCLRQLIDAKVLKVREDGVVYSERIVSDCEKRAKARANGKKGGNPNLQRKGVNPPVNPDVNLPLKAEKKREEKKRKEKDYALDFAEWWLGYPNKQGRTSAERYYALRRERGETKEELLARRDRYKSKKSREGSTTFANGATFLNPKPQGTSANIDDFTDDNFTAVKSCSTCVNGNSYCKYLKRTPDPGEGPCENYQEER